MTQEVKLHELFKLLDDEIHKENWAKIVEICDRSS
jgi:hypothetical protein